MPTAAGSGPRSAPERRTRGGGKLGQMNPHEPESGALLWDCVPRRVQLEVCAAPWKLRDQLEERSDIRRVARWQKLVVACGQVPADTPANGMNRRRPSPGPRG